MSHKNKLLVLATGAECGKGLSAYLQNSLFTPTLPSQDKDTKIYKKYWYAKEMGSTIFCIHAFIYRPVKVGFTEQMSHLPLLLKLAYSLSLHFFQQMLADWVNLLLPEFCCQNCLSHPFSFYPLFCCYWNLFPSNSQISYTLLWYCWFHFPSAVIYSSQLKSEELQSFTLML